MTDVSHYIGEELDLYAEARHWKRYVAGQIAPWLHGKVLEVGAGIGATTRAYWDLAGDRVTSWTALEPDARLAARIAQAMSGSGNRPDVRVATTGELDPSATFDAILYIDVIEHIEHDAEELARAARLLAPGGALIVLSPAHQWLMSPFDVEIGHFRRYSLGMLAAAAPRGLVARRMRYLDSVGMCASAANRWLLKQTAPTPRQISFWDGVLVRTSTMIDPLLGYRVGKSVLGVWERTA